MYRYDNTSLIVNGIIAFIFILIPSIGIYNCSQNQRVAEQELTYWLNDWNIKAGKKSCQYRDSDSNGYITCQYFDLTKNELVEVECAGSMTLNDGCKTIKNASVNR